MAIKMVRKNALVFLVLIVWLIYITFPVSAVSPFDEVGPFDEIWEAIVKLQIGVSSIWNSIFDLQNQIDNIEIEPGVRIAIFEFLDINEIWDENVSCNEYEVATGGGINAWNDGGFSGWDKIYSFYPVDNQTWHVDSIAKNLEVRLVCIKYN